MADYSIEIQHNKATLAQLLRYARQQCKKKGISMEIDREEFEEPYRPESYSCTVVNEEKKCHSPCQHRNTDITSNATQARIRNESKYNSAAINEPEEEHYYE